MKVSWEEGMLYGCVRVHSQPSICGPMIEIRSQMTLTTVCFMQRACFQLHVPRKNRLLAKGLRVSCPPQILADTLRHT